VKGARVAAGMLAAAAVAAAVIALAPSPWFARRLAGYRERNGTAVGDVAS